MSFLLDQPALLLLSLLVLPLAVIGWRSLLALDRLRRTAALVLRTLVLIVLAVLLAKPHFAREHDQLTVIGLLDISGSVQRFAQLPETAEERRTYVGHLREWFRRATSTRAPDDRFGLVVFDGEAIAVSAPTRGAFVGEDLDASRVDGTNIAEAINLGLAMFPADTARRLVLVTDGNETVGSMIESVRRAAGGGGRGRREVPIDVLPLTYRVRSDVQIVEIEAPRRAQPGQTVTVRVVLEATVPTTGRLVLNREGAPVDLNGAEPGRSRAVSVPRGRSVHLAAVVLGDTPVNRLEAIFEPDDADADALSDNNRAEAFTSTPGKGRILVLDPRVQEGDRFLPGILAEAGLPVSVEPPARLPVDLLSLQNYDLIVLDNVPAFDLSTDQHELLARYVHDLGGGLIMLGGENSFGAGGWNGTALEEVLPLELDPPKELRLPQAALVLVLDQSGSMNQPVAGARASQQEVANEAAALAIESLRAESLVGVVTFHSFATELVPLQPNDDPKAISQRVRSISAGGGTDLAPALRKAHEMLRNVRADRKRVVCLTDGQSPTGDLEDIVAAMVRDSIKVTTIGVGDGADHETLAKLADIGQGEYYPVYNAKALPRVLVDSVQVINKPLIKEVPFIPVVQPTGSTLTAGMNEAPVLDGLVVTAPRDDPRASIEMTHPDGEPLLATWQAGLGRVAAFTSDAGGAWSARWSAWPVAAAFWAQLARATARPVVSQETELIAEIEGGRLNLVLEASGREEGYLDYLEVTGNVYPPGSGPVPVRLLQTAPGRYEASMPARAAGNYIVALNPRRGTRQLAPVIGGASLSTGAEFRRYESDSAMLDRIVELTGGRHLDLADPERVDLFDRSGMPTSVSLLPAWPVLLWIAIALLLLDIADRRVAWSAAAIRATFARAVARVSPAHVHGRAAAATLASLREVSERQEAHAEARGRAVEKLQSPPPVERPVRIDATRDAGAPEQPEPSKIAAALGALLGRTKQPPSQDPTPDDSDVGRAPPADDDRRDQDDTEPSSETTRGLLAAKRRARKRLSGDG